MFEYQRVVQSISAVSTWIRETSGCVYRIPFFTEIARHLQGDRIAHGGLRTWGVHSGNRKWVVIILQSNYTHTYIYIYIEYHHLYGVLTYSKPLGRLRKCGYLEMAILIIGNMVMHQVFPILFRQTYLLTGKHIQGAHSKLNCLCTGKEALTAGSKTSWYSDSPSWGHNSSVKMVHITLPSLYGLKRFQCLANRSRFQSKLP